MDWPKYMCIKLTDTSQEFIDEYNLTKYVRDERFYCNITKDIYGLLHTVILTYG